MYIIVIGCGRVGSQLALILDREKHDIVVIDKDPNAFKSLGTSFNGVKLQGYGYDEEVLQRAHIERCDAMERGKMAWIHLNDDAYMWKNIEEGAQLGDYNSGHAVWVLTDLAKKIGHPVHHVINTPRAMIAGVLLILALILYRFRIIIRRRHAF